MAAFTYSSKLLSDITEYGFCYDLILLDIKMPDVTGMELSKKVQKTTPVAPAAGEFIGFYSSDSILCL